MPNEGNFVTHPAYWVRQVASLKVAATLGGGDHFVRLSSRRTWEVPEGIATVSFEGGRVRVGRVRAI